MKIEQTDGTVSYLYKLNFPIKQKDQKQGRIKNRQIEEVFGFWRAKLVYMKEERNTEREREREREREKWNKLRLKARRFEIRKKGSSSTLLSCLGICAVQDLPNSLMPFFPALHVNLSLFLPSEFFSLNSYIIPSCFSEFSLSFTFQSSASFRRGRAVLRQYSESSPER